MTALERRFRRLLLAYPREHRREHEDEMLGVLLAAGPDRSRPSARDAIDLIGGGLRIRARRERRALGDPVWADALAMAGLLTTLLLVAAFAESITDGFLRNAPGAGMWPTPSVLGDPGIFAWPVWAPWPIVLAAGVLGARRTAAGMAWAATLLAPLPSAWIDPWPQTDGLSDQLWWFTLTVITSVALTLSPGPRRGLALLGRWRSVALVASVGAFAEISPQPVIRTSSYTAFMPATWVTVSIAGALVVLMIGTRPDTPAGRRFLVLGLLTLSPILDPMAWGIAGLSAHGAALRLDAVLRFGGPILALVVVVSAVAVRMGHRLRERGPSS